MQGVVFDIQRFALHDGPGIRTVAFLKGCPLRCRWCSNPESYRSAPELMCRSGLCCGCGLCLEACPEGAVALHEGKAKVDYYRCTMCGRCVNGCPSGAMSIAGRQMDINELAELFMRDESYYQVDGGGVTFSGGVSR